MKDFMRENFKYVVPIALILSVSFLIFHCQIAYKGAYKECLKVSSDVEKCERIWKGFVVE